MKVNVIIFGQLTDITGSSNITVADTVDTNALITKLITAHPGLANLTYTIAVEGKVISANTHLPDNSTIALLPPFSGG